MLNRAAVVVRQRSPRALKSRVRTFFVNEFHRIYYENLNRTWEDTRWLGVRVRKCPLDLWVYQELLERFRPELVIETGTFAGGSALFLASCMELLGAGRVITIDLEDSAGKPEHPRISYVIGSSTDDAVLETVRGEAERVSSVMVILDSDHSCDHVLAELRAYSPFVTPGSYLIVEDTNLNGHPVLPDFGPGPFEAVEAFLTDRPPFVRDSACEKYFMTFNPRGYLRRLDES